MDVAHNCNAPTIWIEQPARSSHRYRIECSKCRKFLKWGSREQLEEAKEAGSVKSITKLDGQVLLAPFEEDEANQERKSPKQEEEVISIFATIHPGHYSEEDMEEIHRNLAAADKARTKSSKKKSE